MAMSLLKEALSVIQALHSNRSSVDEFRKGLQNCYVFIVNTYLTDLSKDIKGSYAIGEFTIALSVLEHPPGAPASVVYGFTDSDTKDFTLWVQSRLMRIYASEQHRAVQEKTLTVHNVLLETIRSTDITAYDSMVTSLVIFAKDLFSWKLANGPFGYTLSTADVKLNQPKPLSIGQKQNMERIDLSASNEEQSVLLKTNTLKLLGQQVHTALHVLNTTTVNTLLQTLTVALNSTNSPELLQTSCGLLVTLLGVLNTSDIDDVIYGNTKSHLLCAVSDLIVNYSFSEWQCFKEQVTPVLDHLKTTDISSNSLSISICVTCISRVSKLPSDTTLNKGHLKVLEMLASVISRLPPQYQHQVSMLFYWISELLDRGNIHLILLECMQSTVSAAIEQSWVNRTQITSAYMNTLTQIMKSPSEDIKHISYIIGISCNAVAIYCSAKLDSNASSMLVEILKLIIEVGCLCIDKSSREELSSLTPLFRGFCILASTTEACSQKNVSEFIISVCSLPWYDICSHDAVSSLMNKLVRGDKMRFKSVLAVQELFSSVIQSLMCIQDVSYIAWRLDIIINLMSCGSNSQILSIIQCLPDFLYHHPTVKKAVVQQILFPALTRQIEDLNLAVAEASGHISCILSGLVKLTDNMKLMCRQCDTDEVADVGSVDPSVFEPVLVLLTDPSANVRRALAKSIIRFFSHVKILHSNGNTMAMFQSVLQLLSDSDVMVRKSFSDMPFNSLRHSSMEVIGLVVDKVSTLTSSAGSNIRLMETLMMTMYSLGYIDDANLFCTCIRYFIENSLCHDALISVTSRHYFHQLAQRKNQTTKQIFEQHSVLISECITERVDEILSGQFKSGATVLETFISASKLFEFSNVSMFIATLEKHIVPHLVRSEHKDIPKVLEKIATHVGKKMKQLLSTNLKYIFSYLIRFCDTPTFLRKIKFIEQLTQNPIGVLLRTSFQGVLNHLLLYLGTRTQQIKHGLKYFFEQEGSNQLEPNLEKLSDTRLAELLDAHILGVLVYFDQLLLQKQTYKTQKENVLSSLIQLSGLLGKARITLYRIKISTSLKLAITSVGEDLELSQLCCKAWLHFIQQIDTNALLPMMSSLLVTLLPLLKTATVEAANIFKHLIVTRRNELHSCFGSLYFIPDIPELNDVHAILRNYLVAPVRADTFHLQLQQFILGLKNDNVEVNKQALIKLKSLLIQHKDELNAMISSSETVLPLLSDTIQQLINGCANADDELKLLYADCLAEIGAVDPARVVFTSDMNRTERVDLNLNDIQNSEFEVKYLEVLVKLFIAADNSNMQDCIALAIQGSLSLYEVEQSDKNEIWKSLSPEVQDLITPYFESKYGLIDPDWLRVTSPVYTSDKGKTFKDWICNWTSLLASKVEDDFATKLFKTNIAAISSSTDLALFLLPYVTVYILNNDTHSQLVTDELKAVISDAQTSPANQLCHLAVQALFTVIDCLRTWINTQKAMKKDVSIYSKVSSFVEELPHDLVSKAAFNCHNYTRALLHHEMYMQDKDRQQHLDTLQEIYTALDEPDGVSAVDTIREQPASLHQQAIVWQNVDKLRDAMVCYEEAINIDQSDFTAQEGLMKCYLKLGSWYLAMSHCPRSTSSDNQSNFLEQRLTPYKVEAAWKLGDWTKLSDILNSYEESCPSWGCGVGRLLLAARDKDADKYEEILRKVKRYVMGPLCATSMEGSVLERGYQYLVQLHMINDIESAVKLHFSETRPSTEDIDDLLSQIDSRRQAAQPGLKTAEPLLTLKQSLLLFLQSHLDTQLSDHIHQCWIERASAERKANQLVSAYATLEKAARYNLASREVEKAKLLWTRGDFNHARICLGRIINSHYDAIPSSQVKKLPYQEQITHAEVYLLYAKYSEDKSKFEKAEVMKYYKKAIDLCPSWESSNFQLAFYYDRYLSNKEENTSLYWRVYKQAVLHYVRCLMYGTRNVYQAMSKVITMWLDLGSDIAKKLASSKRNDEAQKILSLQQDTLAQIHTECIEVMKEHVAGFQWLTSFSQLVSRLCNAHQDVSVLLQDVIARLIVEYPQQTVWNMLAISKSSYPIRHQRCQAIFDAAKAKSPDLNVFLKDIIKLTDRLLELTNKSIQRSVHHISLAEHFRSLKRLLDDPNFSEILLPTQTALTVTLPSNLENPGLLKTHNAFPMTPIYLAGFGDRVDVLSSMMRPKKIVCLGSDGKHYPFLCKPKDDLRKDGRLMEFNTIINKLLRKNSMSSRMKLYIKTYAVIPLSEECGLLEWINNMTPYRYIFIHLYKEQGNNITMSECVAAYKTFTSKSPVEVRLPVFNKLKEKHPPVLHRWFTKNFVDPTSWYNARVTYCRTLAVMSVIGYIVGLGDRHGENILLDSTTGGVMHVDFNCLFNKGVTFDWPEVVPFRLTYNMVAAMGPLGYEGFFRKAAEATLHVMCEEKDQLMAVLKPLIYDPLVEWSNKSSTAATAGKRKAKHQNETGEITNEQALMHVQSIESRLDRETDNKALTLSIEGRVQDLISEATDPRNLARMYAGWAAYI